MTRFARAKGSKSSNERKPEEATSWLEMKNSVLSKKSSKPEELEPEKKKHSTDLIKESTSKKTEWASLGDDGFGESVSLIKKHLGQKNNNSSDNKNEKRKNKKLNAEEKSNNLIEKTEKKKKKKLKDPEQKSNNTIEKSEKKEKKRFQDSEEKLNNVKKNENKMKKSKDSVSPEEDSKIKNVKKGKKRTLPDGDIESIAVSPKKKKKCLKAEATQVQDDKEQKHNKVENNKGKNFNKRNRDMKFKNFKRDNKGERNFRSNKQNEYKGGKKFKNRNFQERKPEVEELIINGEKIPITKFQGFYVTLEDAERLKKLRSEMIKEGIPRGKLESAIKLERRRAEKALSRLKKSVCFHCRGHGHLLSNCPNLLEKENTGTGICYKCGSAEHSANECKVVRGTNFQFAECFICKEQGHIARQCPDNPRGLYPQGGSCRECGDVTHLRKDCPKAQAQKSEDVVTVGFRSDRDLECLDEEIANREKQKTMKKVKKNTTVKF